MRKLAGRGQSPTILLRHEVRREGPTCERTLHYKIRVHHEIENTSFFICLKPNRQVGSRAMLIFRCESYMCANFLFAANLRLATTELFFEVPSLRVTSGSRQPVNLVLRDGAGVKKAIACEQSWHHKRRVHHEIEKYIGLGRKWTK